MTNQGRQPVIAPNHSAASEPYPKPKLPEFGNSNITITATIIPKKKVWETPTRALVPKYGQSNNQRLVEQQVPSKGGRIKEPS